MTLKMCIFLQKTKVGKVNGLSLLLDAETYDYVYPVEVITDIAYIIRINLDHFNKDGGEGFKISIHHSQDRPTISLSVRF